MIWLLIGQWDYWTYWWIEIDRLSKWYRSMDMCQSRPLSDLVYWLVDEIIEASNNLSSQSAPFSNSQTTTRHQDINLRPFHPFNVKSSLFSQCSPGLLWYLTTYFHFFPLVKPVWLCLCLVKAELSWYENTSRDLKLIIAIGR